MLKIAYHSCYNHPVPDGHRFPMLKYDLIVEQLLYEGTITDQNIFTPSSIADIDLYRTHDSFYIEKLNSLSLTPTEIRKTGFQLTDTLIRREEIIMQGTIDAALFAIENGIGMNVAGGTHHAFRDRGEGFCLYNDIAIAADYLIANNLAKQILVIDLDVHQGNGTAKIFEHRKDVFTFSMHGASNYPFFKEASDLDIPLPDYIQDKEYLTLLNKSISRLFEDVKPDHVFYQSGVDILATDKMGKLSISREGCKERDRVVLRNCKNTRIPLTISLGGGYSEKLTDIVEAHCNTFRLAQELYF